MRRTCTATAWFKVICLLMMAGFLAGCNSGGSMVPVEGSVSMGSGTISKGSISFHPNAEKGNKATAISVGEIVDGKYKLSTDGKPGAPTGWYKVTVTVTVPSDPKNEYSLPKSLIDTKFNDPKTTTLEVEVKKDGGPYNFEVK